MFHYNMQRALNPYLHNTHIPLVIPCTFPIGWSRPMSIGQPITNKPTQSLLAIHRVFLVVFSLFCLLSSMFRCDGFLFYFKFFYFFTLVYCFIFFLLLLSLSYTSLLSTYGYLPRRMPKSYLSIHLWSSPKSSLLVSLSSNYCRLL